MERKEDHVTVYESIRNATDPYFHYPLYLQTCFQGKMIWVLNEESLQYLIDYLSADMRTVPFNYHKNYKTMRSQADKLPTYMKYAKKS